MIAFWVTIIYLHLLLLGLPCGGLCLMLVYCLVVCFCYFGFCFVPVPVDLDLAAFVAVVPGLVPTALAALRFVCQDYYAVEAVVCSVVEIVALLSGWCFVVEVFVRFVDGCVLYLCVCGWFFPDFLNLFVQQYLHIRALPLLACWLQFLLPLILRALHHLYFVPLFFYCIQG